MLLLLRYIVFLFLTFNICISYAAEVVFEPDEIENEALEVPDFIEAGNLPHPVQFRQILERKDNSPIGRLLLLGQYFEARYPNEALNVDFREDVALIFPEMSAEEIQNTTGYIKMAIRLYRLSKEKVEQIKQEKLTPKDPPLMVSDDEYAFVGDREYIETTDNEVAIVSDFKKVVSYSGNRKEIEAMEAHLDRVFSGKKKTDYEHFISMLKKLDWRALTSYGVTRPSPFVGKAGIGHFEEAEDFKIRLISDTARIGNHENLILGLHTLIPNHRFMLATNLNDELQKPKIELISSLNVENMEVFEPMPLQAVSSELIGVYRGDLAFPIKITLKEKNKPTFFKIQITFSSCDTAFDCQTVVMTPELAVDAENEGKPTASSMSNFIHQSLYNLPKAEHKNFALAGVSYTQNEAGEVLKLNFDFKYNGKIKNFAFFIENEIGTIFKTPEVIIGKNHIYIQTEPVQNSNGLVQKQLTLKARLNDFTAIRQNIFLNGYSEHGLEYTLFYLFFWGVVGGLLFYLTPFGWGLSHISFLVKNNINVLSKFIISKALFLSVLFAFFAFRVTQDFVLLYTYFSPNIFELALCFFALVAFLFNMNARLYEKMTYPLMWGGFVAIFIIGVLSVCGVPYGEKLFSAFKACSSDMCFVLPFGVVVGLMLPDLYAFCVKNKKIDPKLFGLLMAFSKIIICLALCIIGWRLLISLTFKSFLLVLGEIFGGLLLLYYVFEFWYALYLTDLKRSYISGTKNILAILVLGVIFSFAGLVQKSSTFKESQTVKFSLEDISKRAQKGENMIVAFEYPSCLVCKYNTLAVLNEKLITELKEDYKLSYLSQNIEKPDVVTIDFMQKYKRFFRPLYVLYTPYAPNGFVLPNLLDISDLEDAFEMFRVYPSSSKSDSKNKRVTNLR